MSRLTRDGTAEPVSRDQILRHARGQGNVHFPCSADHEQDWQPYPVDPYSATCDDHTYIHTYCKAAITILPVVTKNLPLSPRFSPKIVYRDASSALIPLVNRWLNLTCSAFNLFLLFLFLLFLFRLCFIWSFVHVSRVFSFPANRLVYSLHYILYTIQYIIGLVYVLHNILQF